MDEPDQKDGVESAKYIGLRLFYLYLQFFGVFFVDPDPDCVCIRSEHIVFNLLLIPDDVAIISLGRRPAGFG